MRFRARVRPGRSLPSHAWPEPRFVVPTTKSWTADRSDLVSQCQSRGIPLTWQKRGLVAAMNANSVRQRDWHANRRELRSLLSLQTKLPPCLRGTVHRCLQRWYWTATTAAISRRTPGTWRSMAHACFTAQGSILHAVAGTRRRSGSVRAQAKPVLRHRQSHLMRWFRYDGEWRYGAAWPEPASKSFTPACWIVLPAALAPQREPDGTPWSGASIGSGAVLNQEARAVPGGCNDQRAGSAVIAPPTAGLPSAHPFTDVGHLLVVYTSLFEPSGLALYMRKARRGRTKAVRQFSYGRGTFD